MILQLPTQCLFTIVWFYRANRTVTRNVKVILENYYNVSGQLISYHKPVFKFFMELKKKKREKLVLQLCWRYLRCIGIYLGYRNVDCKRTRAYSTSIKDILKSKLAGWKARVFSQAGKMVFIKWNLAGNHLFTIQGIKICNYIVKEILLL